MLTADRTGAGREELPGYSASVGDAKLNPQQIKASTSMPAFQLLLMIRQGRLRSKPGEYALKVAIHRLRSVFSRIFPVLPWHDRPSPVMAIASNQIPPTINLENPDPELRWLSFPDESRSNYR